ncbi:MAG: YitT family protein [Lachnospiraceae bacterium]|nr:YitT family protein [Lachnospiraceae bacterium]
MYQNEKKPFYIRILVITFASVIIALNIKTFVHTGGLFPGGASGLTLLIQEAAGKFFGIGIPFTVVNLLINAVPIYIGFKYIGKNFTILSCYVIILMSVLTDLIPSYAVTHDMLLISVFSGLINGAAVSLILLMDATSGGTDFLSIFLSEKKGIDSFHVALFINAGILVMAGILFDWDKALYSIIFQFASTSAIRMFYRKYQQATLFIVTTKPKEVCAVISELSRHGATILEGEGAYEHNEKSFVYSVVSSAESVRVVGAIRKKDPAAFVNVLRTERVIGRFYRRPED